ncbi:MAG: 3'-5' exoribonuclease, partial [Bacteroidales bacterium]|nr:3'-5' exoribonuclease [Bacteroidales bacterium]
MDNFVAIDFETANECMSSVCSVGVVIVREGIILEKIYYLINPEPDYYLWRNSCVHGLTFADTKNEKVFPFVWEKIAPKIEGLPLVAHNSPFDEGCLKAVHKVYQMNYPDYQFICTCKASRKTFGKLLLNHQLH